MPTSLVDDYATVEKKPFDKKPVRLLMEACEERVVPKARYSVSKEITVGWWLGWRFRNMKERFACTFYPVAFSDYDVIPDELWILVFQSLPTRDDLDNVKSVCKDFYRVASDEKLRLQFFLTKLPQQPMWQGKHTPISAMIVGDKKIGKTTLATKFLTDSCAALRGFGTRCMCPYENPPLDSKDVLSISVWDVADSANQKRAVLAFPMLCDIVIICVEMQSSIQPTTNLGIGEWLNATHTTTQQARQRLGHSAKAPFLIVGLRKGNVTNVYGSARSIIDSERRRLSAKHGVASAFVECNALNESVDHVFEAAVDCVRQNGGILSKKLSTIIR